MWLVVAALGVLLTAAAVYVFVEFGLRGAPPDFRPYVTPLWVDLSFLPAAAGILLMFLGMFAWWHVDGVKLLTKDGWDHQLLYPRRSAL